MEGDDLSRKGPAEKRYVDLCNEQIFYYRNGQLPREVFEEWLESMVEYLPLFDNATGEVNRDYPGIIDPQLLDGYPTIRRVFVMDGPYNLALRDQRLAFVQLVADKIKKESILRVTLRVLWQDIRDRVSRPTNPR